MTLPRDPADDLDRLMDADAGELGALYRRLPRMDPPKRLDRTVLGEAARAVRGRQPSRHGWMVGVGSAAGVVLAAGIAWQIGRNVAQQQSSHDAFRSAPSVVPVEPITDAPARRRVGDAQGAMSPQATAPAAAGPLQEPAAHTPARKPEPSPPPPPKSAPPPAAMSAAAPPPSAPVVQPPAPFPADDRATHTESEKAVGGAAAANAQPDLLKTERAQESDAAADKADRMEDGKTRSRATPAPSASVELRRDMQLTPDDWISHIRELVRQGRRQQALESLRLMRQMHPDVVIPAKLRAIED